MSNQRAFGGRGRGLFPTLPTGEVLETYESYAQAQESVEKLAKADFPVKQLSIIGSDLKTVERITGKLTYGRMALASAATGAWIGLFLGLVLVIFSPTLTSFAVLGAALLMGAGFGMLFGVVTYSVNRRRRTFTSVTQVMASSYTVLVDPELLHKARNVLRGVDDAPPHPSDPPAPFG
ncbi:general stress protein [Compostimonas suwonensis]|uniref:general stress protein n=1 Tax=Compostimonas suwonensis TaxID=1048394 RepID=UPI001FEB98A1|nr:general stress protein [Compostimonas suwonensis]